MKRKLLSTIMTLCIALMLMTVSAMAEANVAQIGETGYATLQEAINAADNGAEVKLLENVSAQVTIPADKNIVLDLGGFTLTNDNSNASQSTLTVAAGATATVKNGSIVGGTKHYNIQNNGTATFENLTATTDNTGSSMIDNWGTLTINSGNYSGGLDVIKSNEDTTLTINDGTFTLNVAKTSGYMAVVMNYGDATINGGTFTQGVVSAQVGKYAYPQVVLTGIVAGHKDPITKITNGTFITKSTGSIFWAHGNTTPANNFEVSGGTFSKTVKDSYFKEGYFAKKNSDGTYVADGPYDAKVSSTGEGYTTLASAIDAAKTNGSVTLLRNIEVTETVKIPADKKMTLDLNGWTLSTTTTGINVLEVNGTLTLKDGTAKSPVVSDDYETVTYTSGSIVNNGARVTGKDSGAVKVIGGTFTMNNSRLESVHDVAFRVTGEGATATIKNGYLVGQEGAAGVFEGATLNINGGVLVGVDNAAVAGNGTKNETEDKGNTTINITKGTIIGHITTSGYIACGIYHPQSGTLNINGGTIYADGGVGVLMRAGTMNMTGGEVIATGDVSGKVGDATVISNCFGVYVQGVSGYNGALKGEFTAKISGTASVKAADGVPALSLSNIDTTNGTIAVSGGQFSSAVDSEYCADGFVPKTNIDGTYGVKEAGPIEVWTGYSGTKVDSYATIQEAAANLGDNKWIVIGKDYTLTEDFTIPTGVFLDVAKDATLTVAENMTLTVAANAKRLGVRTGATLVNNGTIMIEEGYSAANPFGYVMKQDNATFDTTTLTVPTGCILEQSGQNYYAAEVFFEATYSDGTTKLLGKEGSWANAAKVTLLKGVTDFAHSFGSADKLADNFVLDLGGYTLSGKTTATNNVLSTSVTMTIQNGTIKYASSNTGSGALYTSADVTIASDAIIDGGAGYAIWTDGYGHTLTVNGTVKSDSNNAITSNGDISGELIAECNIVVNDGAVIEAAQGVAIYHPELGTVTVNDGAKISGHTGIEMCAGKLVVSGGSVTSTGTDESNADNVVLNGAAISILDRNYPGGSPSAEITGGTFTSATAPAIRAYHWEYPNATDWTAAGTNVNISGGTFSSIPDNMAALCASGYTATQNANGTYGVRRVSSSSSSSGSSTSAITAPSKTENGTVTVSPKSASKGDTVTITVKPDSGCVLGSLTVTDSKGNELTLTDKGDGKYTFTMPSGRVEVKASFAKEVETSPFADVATDAYYYEAVKWAVKNGITDGVGNDLFAPGQPCTRAQIVTFLWRAAGSPEPKGTAVGMTDVVSGSYYEKAVAWAIENGVTTGTTATTFSPDATCTRAQAVTFLARALNAKAASAAEFSDVPTDSYFAEAVAWAAADGVTEGVGNGLFAPDNDCARGQIVTFLYRAYNK